MGHGSGLSLSVRAFTHPHWNLSLPVEGVESYHLAHAAQSSGACSRSHDEDGDDDVRIDASCLSTLYHGKLSTACLKERNLTEAMLPCVRPLFITGVGASGTTNTGSRLIQVGLNTAQEKHYLEGVKVLVSWLSRTDVWRLGENISGPAVDIGLVGSHGHLQGYGWEYELKRVAMLNRCLYRRVLVQVRDPLRVVRSYLSMLHVRPWWSFLADQLLARSGAIPTCLLPVLRKSDYLYVNMNNTASRRRAVLYLAHHWWAWNSAAIAAADDFYQVETLGANLSALCALGGLTSASEAERCAKDRAYGARVPQRNSHSSEHEVQPVTWAELCAADRRWARRVFHLAGRLGYRYEGGLPCAGRVRG